MKKYILGIIAVLMIVTISAFKITTKNNNVEHSSYKWFQISGNILPSAQVPSASATYLGEGTTPPQGMGCDGSTYLCVAGFNASQVNGSNQLINNSQVAQETSVRKGN